MAKQNEEWLEWDDTEAIFDTFQKKGLPAALANALKGMRAAAASFNGLFGEELNTEETVGEAWGSAAELENAAAKALVRFEAGTVPINVVVASLVKLTEHYKKMVGEKGRN